MSEFFRPSDVRTKTRNKRRQQLRVLGVALLNVATIAIVAVSGWWIWTTVRSNQRFAITNIELAESSRADDPKVLDVVRRLEGRNLFETDLDAVRSELAAIDGIREATVEKIVPDGLRIEVSERTPVAIWRSADGDFFIDDEGKTFTQWSGAGKALHLPSIANADSRRIEPAVQFLAMLRRTDEDLASRVLSIEPISHGQWVIVDKELATRVLVSESDVVDKWRLLYAIAQKERWAPRSIEYADLRFDRQIVVKPGTVGQSSEGSDHGQE